MADERGQLESIAIRILPHLYHSPLTVLRVCQMHTYISRAAVAEARIFRE